MHVSELDYSLPEELIAQHPCERRDESRLLVVDRTSRRLRTDRFRNVASYLRAGDCLVLNDTKVVRARLRGHKPTGGRVEVFLLHELGPGSWDALVRPSAKIRVGAEVEFSGIRAEIGERIGHDRRRVTFDRPDVLSILEQIGEVPLPPYIHRDAPDPSDMTRYQTIYARDPGSVAAPTAGLHFTDEVFASLDAAGVSRVTLTLHVGYGTFSPVRTERIEDHVLDPEEFMLTEDTARRLNETRANGGRIVAVGTTSTRVLESQFSDAKFHAASGSTSHFIYPPYTFQAVDVLQTNFHLPRSSLLALVYAFGGRELICKAYELAIRERFRFYSYGDVMLII